VKVHHATVAIAAPPTRVLVVEDVADLRDFYAILLREEGYEVACACDGSEALRWLSWAPDVILLDLMMPVMDGWAFCDKRQKSRAFAEVPVIAISATDISESNRPAGVDAVVAKPIDADKFARLAVRMAGRKIARERSRGVLH
jgi:CheY-like chemotaxis protein